MISVFRIYRPMLTQIAFGLNVPLSVKAFTALVSGAHSWWTHNEFEFIHASILKLFVSSVHRNHHDHDEWLIIIIEFIAFINNVNSWVFIKTGELMWFHSWSHDELLHEFLYLLL